MSKPEIATNVGKLAELSREREALAEQLSALYEQWETYSEELETLN